jgi:hypothetical protein
MKKTPKISKPITALSLQRGSDGSGWIVNRLTIQDGTVIDSTPSKKDMLPYTMSKATALLRDMVERLR